MNIKNAIESTEDLDEKLKQVYAQFEAGEITPNIARVKTLIIRARFDRINLEMRASELGKSFRAIETREVHRNARPSLKRVA